LTEIRLLTIIAGCCILLGLIVSRDLSLLVREALD